MSLLKFIVFSSLEYLSSFIFILIQFRFSLRENIEKIILISVLLSFVSYSFIEADLRDISPLVQNAIFMIYIWMVLKVSFSSSFIMLLTGYTVFGLVQTCIVAVFFHFGLINAGFEMGASITFQIQVFSSLIMITLSLLTYYLKGGFSFIEVRSRLSKKPMSGKYKLFVIYIILAFGVTLATNLYIVSNNPPSFLLMAFVLLIVLVFLFYITFKRDESVG